MRRAIHAPFIALVLAAPAAASVEPVVQACSDCHLSSGPGHADATPLIEGQSRGYLLHNLELFQRGQRKTAARGHGAADLNGADLERLAEHFSRLPYKPARQATEPALVARGARIYADGCVKCHTREGRSFDEAEAGVPGPLLAGQKLAYLRRALEEFKYRIRDMQMHMGTRFISLNDSDLDGLAHFFASRP